MQINVTMGKLLEIPQAPLIRCVAIYADGSRKVRLFPDGKEGIQEAVNWEWERLNDGATIVEYYREDEKKGAFYSSRWVQFKTGKNH